MGQKTLFAGYIHKAPVRRIGLNNIAGLHIGQRQCDQRVSLTAASTDRRDADLLPPIGEPDNRCTGIFFSGCRAAVTIPAELRVEVLLTGWVGKAAIAVGLYLTGH